MEIILGNYCNLNPEATICNFEMLCSEDDASLCAFELQYRKAHIRSQCFVQCKWKWFSLETTISWDVRGKYLHLQFSRWNFQELSESGKLRISFQWSLCTHSAIHPSDVSITQSKELAGMKLYKLNINYLAVLPLHYLPELKWVNR